MAGLALQISAILNGRGCLSDLSKFPFLARKTFGSGVTGLHKVCKAEKESGVCFCFRREEFNPVAHETYRNKVSLFTVVRALGCRE